MTIMNVEVRTNKNCLNIRLLMNMFTVDNKIHICIANHQHFFYINKNKMMLGNFIIYKTLHIINM